ncbi:uncharacterized protein [Palaemon carinicauda]|uniref:uncharacterized protein n=1 Tax=Palaemon carinicauda TaxID=392227 RepID=UPI0035B622B3
MRGVALIVGLLLVVVQQRGANVSGRSYEGHHKYLQDAELPQGDDPAPALVERHIYSLLEAMKQSLGELSNKRSSWYDRYDALAMDVKDNSAMIQELLEIGRVAMPIIWTTSKIKMLHKRRERLEKGQEIFYKPPNVALGEPVPHPLRILPTELTDQDDFSIELILKTNEVANVGIRLMFEPEKGHEFDWDNDDLFLGVHLRWYFDYGNSREISLHDKYDGSFRAGEVITPASHWPDIKVGEKFGVSIVKKQNCFNVVIIIGKDLYVQEQAEEPYVHKFCPRPRRTSKMMADPKKLWLVVNEDRPGRGQLEVHNLIWYRNV